MSLVDLHKRGLFDPTVGIVTDPVTASNFSLGAAVRHGLVDAVNTNVRFVDTGDYMDLDSVLESGMLQEQKLQIDSNSEEIYIGSSAEKILINQLKMKCDGRRLSQPIKSFLMTESGKLDSDTIEDKIIIDSATGHKLTFKQALDCGILKIIDEGAYTSGEVSDRCFVRDSANEKWCSWNKAIYLNIVVDSYEDEVECRRSSKQNKHVSFESDRLLSSSTENYSMSRDKRKHSIDVCLKADLPVTLDAVIESGLYDPIKNTVTNIETDEEVSFIEAINLGLIHKDSLVRDSVSKDILTLGEAIDNRLIDPVSGRMMLSSGLPIALNFALSKGLVVRCKSPFHLTLSEVIEEGLYSKEKGKFLSPDNQNELAFSEAIFSGMLDSSLIRVRDTKDGTVHELDTALQKGLINISSGSCVDALSGNVLSLLDSIEAGILIDLSNQPKYGVLDIIEEDLVEIDGAFIDPGTNNPVSLKAAIDSGLIDRTAFMVRNLNYQSLVTLDGAIAENIIDLSTGKYKCSDQKWITFSEAVSMGYIVQNLGSTDLNLIDAIHEDVYNPVQQKFTDPRTGQIMNFGEAIKSKLIKCEDILVKNTETNEVLSFDDAKTIGLVTIEDCVVHDVSSDEFYDLKSALDKGLLQQTIHCPKLGLVEAVKCGIYDADSKEVIDKVSKMCIGIKQGIEFEIIDLSQTLVKDVKLDSFVPLDVSFNDTFSKTEKKTIFSEDLDIGEKICGDLIVDVPSEGFTIPQIVKMGLYDKQMKKICDPRGNLKMTLLQATICKFVDDRNTQVILIDKGVVSLKDAVKHGVVDPVTCYYMENLSPHDTVSMGLIIDSFEDEIRPILSTVDTLLKDSKINQYLEMRQILETSVSFQNEQSRRRHFSQPQFGIQRAVEQGIFEKHRCTFHDPRTNMSVTLGESLKTGLIHRTRSRVKNPESGKFVSLSEAVDKGIISDKTASMLDRKHMKTFPLERAIDEHMILDVPFTRVTLDEAVHYGLLNMHTLRMQSMTSDDRVPLPEAVVTGLIDNEETLIKDPVHNNLMTLSRAVDTGLFLPQTAQLKCGDDKLIDLVTAIEQGFVLNGRSLCNILKVSNSRQRSTESQSSEESVIKEQKTDLRMTIQKPIKFGEALRLGIINADTMNVTLHDKHYSLLQAIEEGIIDVENVSFYDETSNERIPLTLALRSNMIGTGDQSLPEGINFNVALDKGLLVERLTPAVNDGPVNESDKNGEETEWQKTSREMTIDKLLSSVSKESCRIGTLSNAIQKGLLDDLTGMIKDPFTGKLVTIQEMINNNLINPHVKEIRSGEELMTLSEAIDCGIVDPVDGKYLDNETWKPITSAYMGEQVNVSTSVDQVDSKSSVEIYVEEILSSDQNRIKLREAFSTGILNQSNSKVIDPDTIQPITLRRAASLGMIDANTGDFKNPQTGDTISLAEAVTKGFILTPKGLSLYSAVNQGLYDGENRMFIDPSTGKEHSLREMIEMEIVTSQCQEIRDLAREGIIITLQKAIDKKIIEWDENVYVNVINDKVYSFSDAIAAGLIVSNIPREGLRESQNSDVRFRVPSPHNYEHSRYKYLAETPMGPFLNRPFNLGNRSRTSSSSDLSNTDSSGTDKEGLSWLLPLSSDAIRQIISTAKSKKEAAKKDDMPEKDVPKLTNQDMESVCDVKDDISDDLKPDLSGNLPYPDSRAKGFKPKQDLLRTVLDSKMTALRKVGN